MPRFTDRMPRATQLKLGAAALLAIGVAGGAGAVSLTRPSIEMAPTTPTAIARLATTDGVVTVKGRVAEVFGDRFVLQDGTGRTMIDAGRDAKAVSKGAAMTVQGRYADGQVRASYLVDPAGQVTEVGPRHGPGGPGGPGPKGPRHGPGHGPDGGPDRGPDGPPPPPPADGAAPPRPAAGTVPPPPPTGGATPAARPAGATAAPQR